MADANALEQRTEILLAGRHDSIVVPLGATQVENAITQTLQQGSPFVKFPLIAGAVTVNVAAIAAIRPALSGGPKSA